jgi:putative phosphoesterase
MRTKHFKIAALSDVHGNLPALEAILADCKKQGADQIWYLGDFVGYVPYPNEVIELLQKENATSIIGNYDLKVLSFAKNARQWKKNKSPEKYSAFEWNYKALTLANKNYLQKLPKERRIEVAGLDVLLTHGSPADNEEGICSATSAKRLNELAKIARADLVLCGHTHRPLRRRAGNVLFVNAGSVGRPEGDTRASYAILNFSDNHVTARHYKVEYDITRAAKAIRDAALSAGLIDVLEKAVSLDALKNQRDSKASDNMTDEKKLASALALAEKCNYEKQHTHQVEKLALRLFDQLTKLHRLGEQERFLLRCAAILHDIGWLEGQKGHHKTALRIIMDSPNLRFDFQQRRIIGLIARYHRKAVPKEQHSYFCDLDAKNRDTVCKLAGILRVADGLDRTHQNRVKDISCTVDEKAVKMICRSAEMLDAEFAAAKDKGELFENALARKLVFERRRVDN